MGPAHGCDAKRTNQDDDVEDLFQLRFCAPLLPPFTMLLFGRGSSRALLTRADRNGTWKLQILASFFDGRDLEPAIPNNLAISPFARSAAFPSTLSAQLRDGSLIIQFVET